MTGMLALLAFSIYASELEKSSFDEPKKESLKLNTKGKKKIKDPGKGWYMSLSGGYGFPFLATNKRSPLKQIGDKYWYQRGNTDLSVKPLYGTNGGGFAANIGWGYMFNKYIGIDVLHTIAWHPEQLDAKIDLDNYYATQKTGTFGIYVAPHLIMRWDNGKRFGVTGKAGIVAPIFGKTTSRAYIKDSQGRIIETLAGLPILPLNIPGLLGLEIEIVGKAHTSYHPTLGVSASIGFDVKLNKMLSLFANDGLGGLVRGLTGQTGLPTIDINQPMAEPGQKFNASTLYINAGLRLDFNSKKSKNTSTKYDAKSTKPSKSKKGSSTMVEDPDSNIPVAE